MLPDYWCGYWVPDDVLFGENTASDAAQTAVRLKQQEAGIGENMAIQRFNVRFAWNEWKICWTLLNKPLEYPPKIHPPYLRVQQVCVCV